MREGFTSKHYMTAFSEYVVYPAYRLDSSPPTSPGFRQKHPADHVYETRFRVIRRVANLAASSLGTQCCAILQHILLDYYEVSASLFRSHLSLLQPDENTVGTSHVGQRTCLASRTVIRFVLPRFGHVNRILWRYMHPSVSTFHFNVYCIDR